MEVLSRQEAEEADDAAYRASRRAARRAKLSAYFEEEYSAILDTLSIRAGDAYQKALGEAQQQQQQAGGGGMPAPFGGATSVMGDAAMAPPSQPPPQPQAQPTTVVVGSGNKRLAWCRTFDSSLGEGILVDLEEKSLEWRVDRSALLLTGDAAAGLPSGSRVLHPGEFVEYDCDAARLFAEGGAPPDGWVSGILGWPLMCEAVATSGAKV